MWQVAGCCSDFQTSVPWTNARFPDLIPWSSLKCKWSLTSKSKASSLPGNWKRMEGAKERVKTKARQRKLPWFSALSSIGTRHRNSYAVMSYDISCVCEEGGISSGNIQKGSVELRQVSLPLLSHRRGFQCMVCEIRKQVCNISEKSEPNYFRRLQLIFQSELPPGKLVKVCKAVLHGWGEDLTWHLDTSATA